MGEISRSTDYDFILHTFYNLALDVPSNFRLLVMLQLYSCGLHHDGALPPQASTELPSEQHELEDLSGGRNLVGASCLRQNLVQLHYVLGH